MEETTELRKRVYQNNKLIEAPKPYNIDEMRVLYLALATVIPILPKDKDWHITNTIPEVFVPKDKVIEQFGGNHLYYTKLKKVFQSVMKLQLYIENADDEGFDYYNVFEHIGWRGRGKNAGLHIKFTNSMYPYIYDLQKRAYTPMLLRYAFELSSSYALKILEMVMKVRNQQIPTVRKTTEELKEYLNLDVNSYPGRIDVFKRKVILKAVNEINDTLGIEIEVTPYREGRTIAGFDFTLVKC